MARHGRLCCRLCGPAISFPLLCHTMPAMACVVPSDTHAPMTLACPMQATHHFPRAAAMRSAMVATSLATGQVSGVYIGCRSAVVYCPCHAMPCHLMMCRVPAMAWSTVPCLAMPGHFHNGSVHVVVQHAMSCHTVPCHAAPSTCLSCITPSSAGQLGDGRAICLGQTVNSEGERWELQLKVGCCSYKGAVWAA